ncbi:MAG: hypothetical protein ISS70_19900 [Phycisphaerae bacterium]|nr:hypothetical protein [Phycisphaerae bacterium]
MLNKFSFGPSQEDEGRKKTVHSTEGSCLYSRHVCPIVGVGIESISQKSRSFLGKATNESINVENERQAHQKPPRSLRRIAGEILAGMATGVVVAVLVLYVVFYMAIGAADCLKKKTLALLCRALSSK